MHTRKNIKMKITNCKKTPGAELRYGAGSARQLWVINTDHRWP